jgi:hypothetical protein
MLVRRNEEAELREHCVSLAVQAGAKDTACILSLAEELRKYIQFGAAEAEGRLSNDVSERSKFLSVAELSAENDA